MIVPTFADAVLKFLQRNRRWIRGALSITGRNENPADCDHYQNKARFIHNCEVYTYRLKSGLVDSQYTCRTYQYNRMKGHDRIVWMFDNQTNRLKKS